MEENLTDNKTFFTPKVRLIIIITLLIALYIIGKATGMTNYLNRENIHHEVMKAGAWGVLLYTAIFCIGQFLHIPGLIFVAVGIVVYGKSWGFIIVFLSGVASVSMSFIIVRGIGGKVLAEVDKPLLKKMTTRLDKRPILIVIGLRSIFCLAPTLNYILALSSIRFRDYVVGSTIGLLPPIFLATLLFDWLFK